MATPVRIPDTCIGDAFTLPIQCTDPTQNFTTVSCTAALALATPPYTNPAFSFTPVITFPSGTATFIATLSMTGAQTTALGLGSYIGNLTISMTGYGPYTVVNFLFNIVPVIP